MKGIIMKKILILSILVMFTGSAFAGSCPMIAKNLDSKNNVYESKNMSMGNLELKIKN